nr:hypothetical protein [Brevibacterium ravenspurgense]
MIRNSIYTDVLAHEAVNGIDGFNFESTSGGFDETDGRVVVANLLHRVSDRWPAEADPLCHPRTAVYVNEGNRLYFSRGKSTGSTLSGRRGNQLTQAIVLLDEGELTGFLPAQFLAAADWNLEKSGSHTAPSWPEFPTVPAAYDADSVIEWGLVTPWIAENLDAIVTMFDEAASGGRVVVVAEDMADYLRMCVFGTALLTMDQALATELRAFIDDPYRGRGNVVGYTPAFGQENIRGTRVIDMVEQTVSHTEVSPIAARKAVWLRTQDFFDASELINTAGRLSVFLDPMLALDAAELLALDTPTTAFDSWAVAVKSIEGLGQSGSSLLDEFADSLETAIVTHRLTTAEQFERAGKAAQSAQQAGADDIAGLIFLPAMESAIAAPENLGTFARAYSGRGKVTLPSSLDSEQLRLVVRDAVTTAAEDDLPAVLTLAKPLENQIPDDDVRQPLMTAFSLVQRQPALLADVDNWLWGISVKNALAGWLLDELSRKLPGAYAALDSGDWDLLVNVPRASSPRSRTALRDWVEIRNALALPRRELVASIEAGKFNGACWHYLLERLPFEGAQQAWCAWLTLHGDNLPLVELASQELERISSTEPTAALKKWERFASSVSEASARTVETENRVRGYWQAVEQIPTPGDRIREFKENPMKSFKKMFTGRGDKKGH